MEYLKYKDFIPLLIKKQETLSPRMFSQFIIKLKWKLDPKGIENFVESYYENLLFHNQVGFIKNLKKLNFVIPEREVERFCEIVSAGIKEEDIEEDDWNTIDFVLAKYNSELIVKEVKEEFETQRQSDTSVFPLFLSEVLLDISNTIPHKRNYYDKYLLNI